MRVIKRRKADKERTKARRQERTIKLMGYLDSVSDDTIQDDNYFHQKRGVAL